MATILPNLEWTLTLMATALPTKGQKRLTIEQTLTIMATALPTKGQKRLTLEHSHLWL